MEMVLFWVVSIKQFRSLRYKDRIDPPKFGVLITWALVLESMSLVS